VDLACDELFSGSGLTEDEDRRVRRRDDSDES
jgi:hypothetical protein